MLELVEALIASTLDAAPPLVLAAVGATLSEKAGVVNVGVEGMMRAGAFCAAVAALVVPTGWALFAGVGAGAAVAAVHGLLCIRLRSEQVISGMALNLVMLALGTFLLEAAFDSPSGTPAISSLGRVRLPWFDAVPVLRALSNRTPFTWLAVVVPVAVHVVLRRTRWGLRVRAAGEYPPALAAVGVRVGWVRLGAVVASGALAGLGGAALSTATLDRFEHHMPAGLGFMAVAAMVFGRWSPLGAAGAAAFFALGNGVRIGVLSSAPWLAEAVPGGALLALPYVLTLVVLAWQGRRGGAPSALGRPFDPELR